MFAAWWKDRFGDVLPMGHLLRDALRKRWFRIHSLPESKRYAEDEAERQILLDWQRRLAMTILPPHSHVFLVVPWYEMVGLGDAQRVGQLEGVDLRCGLKGKLDAESEDNDVCFLVAEQEWDFAAAEPALLAVAEDQLRAIWANTETGEVFAPYDGGVDVFLASRARRHEVKPQFADWLSHREDGL